MESSKIESQKVKCDCGKEISKKGLSKHVKTKSHLNKVSKDTVVPCENSVVQEKIKKKKERVKKEDDISCVCGKTIRKSYYKKHLKSKFHLKHAEEKPEENENENEEKEEEELVEEDE
jgi:hypothetical protein